MYKLVLHFEIGPPCVMIMINEVKKLLCDFCEKLQEMCSEASVSRYLRARNRNVKKAPKMLRESMKWRLQSRPEKILWEDVSAEAEMGKVYKANYLDKLGSTVLVMSPGFQIQAPRKMISNPAQILDAVVLDYSFMFGGSSLFDFSRLHKEFEKNKVSMAVICLKGLLSSTEASIERDSPSAPSITLSLRRSVPVL